MKIFKKVVTVLISLTLFFLLVVFSWGKFSSRYEKYKIPFLESIYGNLISLYKNAIYGETPLVKIYLTFGGTIEGKLLRETENEYIVEWKEQEYVLDKDQVKSIEKNKGIPGWDYTNDIVVKLKNGTLIDYKIIEVTDTNVKFQYAKAGGEVEFELDREDIEHLLFKPVHNRLSQKTGKSLKKKFPKMKFYTQGDTTIITDAYITGVRQYQNTVLSTYTQIYFKFFELFKTRRPVVQNFVVIFDNYHDFVKYAIKDGVPGWAVLGYYKPKTRTLYLFNVLGEKFSNLLYEMIIGTTERVINAQANQIKRGLRRSDQMVVDGKAADIKDKYWRIYNLLTSELRNLTLSTLRHEFTHGIFSNWGLQNIKVSRSEKSKWKLRKKKKQVLDNEDKESRQKWLENLLLVDSKKDDLEMKAANSWIVEGVATFCETYPIGSQNNNWLFMVQEMIRNNNMYPLETLTFYKIGSFPGMYSRAMIKAYAQSWALTTFLMDKYPKEVIRYMRLTAAEGVRDDKEDLKLLLDCLGKDVREIDKELKEYILNKYPQLEDPFVERTVFMHNLFKEFLQRR